MYKNNVATTALIQQLQDGINLTRQHEVIHTVGDYPSSLRNVRLQKKSKVLISLYFINFFDSSCKALLYIIVLCYLKISTMIMMPMIFGAVNKLLALPSKNAK